MREDYMGEKATAAVAASRGCVLGVAKTAAFYVGMQGQYVYRHIC
jgi:hypothetical protein